MMTYDLFYISLSDLSAPDYLTSGDTGFSGKAGTWQAPAAGGGISFDFSGISLLRINDENASFDDDPLNPEWAGSGSEVDIKDIASHRQTNAEPIEIDGHQLRSGELQIEAEYRVNLLGSDGKTYEMVALRGQALDGANPWWPYGADHGILGFTFTGASGWPGTGVSLTFLGNDPDGPSIDWVQMPRPHGATCFAAGTLIMTDRGTMPVEQCQPGTKVLTKDHGFQSILWHGSCHIGVDANPKARPIRIAQHAMGPNMPMRPLLVSPQHRMLIASPIAARIFDAKEVLIAAKHLSGHPGISEADDVSEIRYHHLLCQSHEILLANGAWAESMLPGPEALKSLDPVAREEITAACLPENVSPARKIARGKPVGELLARSLKNEKALVCGVAKAFENEVGHDDH